DVVVARVKDPEVASLVRCHVSEEFVNIWFPPPPNAPEAMLSNLLFRAGREGRFRGRVCALQLVKAENEVNHSSTGQKQGQRRQAEDDLGGRSPRCLVRTDLDPISILIQDSLGHYFTSRLIWQSAPKD